MISLYHYFKNLNCHPYVNSTEKLEFNKIFEYYKFLLITLPLGETLQFDDCFK